MDIQSTATNIQSFSKVDETSFTITIPAEPVVQTYNLDQLLRQKSELTNRIADRQKDLDATNLLIAEAQKQGLQTQAQIQLSRQTTINSSPVRETSVETPA